MYKHSISIFFWTLFLLSFSTGILAQPIKKSYTLKDTTIFSGSEANADNFSTTLIELLILDGINNYLDNKNLPLFIKNELLQNVAQNQATYMANKEVVNPEQENKETRFLENRMQYYGGSKLAQELIDKTPINKGKIPFTYAKIADDIVFKWLNSNKKAKLFTSGKFNLIGISAALDEKKRKLYVSAVLGNLKSFNQGAALKNQLKVPFTEKTYGLKAYENASCKKVSKADNLNQLQQGLYVENDIIYLETKDAKSLEKLLKNKKDGLAVDIIQWDQFACGSPNILDHNLPNTGYLTKRLYAKKILKKNLANNEENPKQFKTKLGEMPSGIGQHELNLVIIQDKSYCRSIGQSFTINPPGEFTQTSQYLGDTLTINSEFRYKPVADSVFLSFKIPFEKEKYDYKAGDIEPFLALLNEPAFSIYDLKITAFSSIEGSDETNIELQKKRAESIINALETRQDLKMDTEIITAYNWEEFKSDIDSTPHKLLAKMDLKAAQNYIREKNLSQKLEPILSKHRYAQIEMNVVYSIVGDDELPFVLRKFEKAIEANDLPLALSVEKFILNQISRNRYPVEVLQKLKIPLNTEYAGMEMNRLWMLNEYNAIDSEDFKKQVNYLYTIDPNNEYIAYNKVNLKVNDTITDLKLVAQIQGEIDRLYYTPLKKATVDKLNIKYQLKVMKAIDRLGPNLKLKTATIKRLQNGVDLERISMKRAGQLASWSMEIRDFSYAHKALEHWILNGLASEDVVFSYLSLCSLEEEKMYSERFNRAMSMAYHKNPKRYCELFNGKAFTIKVFENPTIKESYCNYCLEAKQENSIR